MFYSKIYSSLKLLVLTVFTLYITILGTLPVQAASPNENCITVNAGASMGVIIVLIRTQNVRSDEGAY